MRTMWVKVIVMAVVVAAAAIALPPLLRDPPAVGQVAPIELDATGAESREKDGAREGRDEADREGQVASRPATGETGAPPPPPPVSAPAQAPSPAMGEDALAGDDDDDYEDDEFDD
jgi:hypothetical protein